MADTAIKPRLRGVFHQWAFIVSVVAGAMLVAAAPTGRAAAVGAVYAVALAGMFGASALYHRVAWRPSLLPWFRRLDHSMIFVLIAASYTPVAVLVLGGTWEAVLLSLAWAGAVAGVTLKLAQPDGHHVIGGILYMALGWLAVIALPQLFAQLTTPEAVLMVTGGLLYTAGAIVFATKRPDPAPSTFGYHEIWHAFMVAAAGCHYAMILLILRPP